MFDLDDQLLVVDVEAGPYVLGTDGLDGEGRRFIRALVREQSLRIDGNKSGFPFLQML